MAETIDDMSRKLQIAIEPGFRGRLTARGAARSIVWHAGVLPEDSPGFSELLSEELLSHGFGLLRLALKLRDNGVVTDDVLRAFELAAESLEYVVKNGDPNDEARGFYRTVAAASYHLGAFSARAFSLVTPSLESQNLAIHERALCLLLLRRLDNLDSLIITELSNPENSDAVVAGRLYDPLDSFDSDDALVVATSENYLRALAAFLFCLRTGDQAALSISLRRLKEGEDLSALSGFVSTWWIYRITRLLIEDLWNASLQNLLPLASSDGSDWTRLREIFVLLMAARSTSELDLWPSQVSIASRVLDTSDDIVASLPTSAGKTRIAELCILRALSLSKRVVFITPLRSLSAQTEGTLKRTFKPLGFDVSSLYGSAGSSVFDLDSLGNRPIVVSTPEKLDFALRNNPDLLNEVGLVVLDEGHMLGTSEREVRYEVLIQRLLRRTDANSRRIVCLSAMLPSGDEFDDFVEWLRDDEPGEPITSNWRPTRQQLGQIVWNGSSAFYELELQEGTKAFLHGFVEQQDHTGPKGGKTLFPASQNDLVAASAWRLVNDGHSVLVYCPERRSVNAMANAVLRAHKKGFLGRPTGFDPQVIQRAVAIGIEWLGHSHPAIRCLSLGVAVHHGVLPKAFLREIDSLIREKKVPIVVASPTLARGLNIAASCVLFQSTQRFDPTQGRRIGITSEEFANVAGRAGRAYVDLDGQVLGVCYKHEQLSQWKEILGRGAARRLESGLLQTIFSLLSALRRKLGFKGDFLEFILNSSNIWDVPPGNPEQISEWKSALATLDIALLSLIGDENCDIDDVANALDRVLSSSFLRRRLKRQTELVQSIVSAVFTARAKYICSTTTVSQRRGYFFSGIGLSAGRFLDENALHLNGLLLEADAAIRNADTSRCITSLTSIAELVFSVDPFKPRKFPDEWKEIAVGWLSGKLLTDLSSLSQDASVFIEDGLVYRLAWAVEAIRVRSRANEEGIFSDRPSAVVSAIETGTVSIPESLLLQAGLSSRVAASDVLRECPSHFEDVMGMWEWFYSPRVQRESKRQGWSTPQSREAWLEFAESQRSASYRKVSVHEQVLPIELITHEEASAPTSDLFAKHDKSDSVVRVFTPEMNEVGTIDCDAFDYVPSSAFGYLADFGTISLRYLRPD